MLCSISTTGSSGRIAATAVFSDGGVATSWIGASAITRFGDDDEEAGWKLIVIVGAMLRTVWC